MEQHHAMRSDESDHRAFAVSPSACGTGNGLHCSLTLGKNRVCGDARHREVRAADSDVISGGARSRDVWLVRTGILRLQRHAYDGRRQILSLFFPGEIVGFEEEFRDGVTVETAIPSSLCRIDRRWFDRMVTENTSLRAELFRQKQEQLDRLYWLTWSLGALKPEERLAPFWRCPASSCRISRFPTAPGFCRCICHARISPTCWEPRSRRSAELFTDCPVTGSSRSGILRTSGFSTCPD